MPAEIYVDLHKTKFISFIEVKGIIMGNITKS
jgi:hypothetical protein